MFDFGNPEYKESFIDYLNTLDLKDHKKTFA